MAKRHKKGCEYVRNQNLVIYAGLAIYCTAMPALAVAASIADPAADAAETGDAAPIPSAVAPSASAAASDAVATPSFSGPLAPNAHPLSVNAGPLGVVNVTGQFSGVGLLQNHATTVPGTLTAKAVGDVTNAQVEFQTTKGPVQFYVQVGAYSIPALGTPYLRAGSAIGQTYGALPVGYAKVVLSPDLFITGGFLPTLVGAESTFTFQDMNVERGLLWNQEPAVSRGAQINYAHGKLSAALSLNDGYFSGKFNWISGTVGYAFDAANAVTVVGASSLSRSYHNTYATPVAQNNGSIFNLMYSYSNGPVTLSPYLQYNRAGHDTLLGLGTSADVLGAAMLAKYTLSGGYSIAARAEYLKSGGADCGTQSDCVPTNLLYGPHSKAVSLTVTPTYQKGIFFARAELSYTKVDTLAPGLGFGAAADQGDQVRGLLEAGVLF